MQHNASRPSPLPTTAFHHRSRSILTASPKRPFSPHTAFNKPRLPALQADQWQSKNNSRDKNKKPEIQAVTSTCDLQPETGEGSGTALILSAH
jgi:hypothetical protein